MNDNANLALRLGYGLVPIVAGADKFTNRLVDWEKYLAPGVERALPFKARTFMKAVGVVEMAAGTLVLSRWSRLGAYLVAGWLAAIAAQLLASGDNYDIAARDVLLSLGALALASRGEARPAQELPRRTEPPRVEEQPAPALH